MLDLTGKEILSEFGKGIGMPGSGCVAALAALSGTQLLISVCKLTTSKERYSLVYAEIQDIRKQLEAVCVPALEDVFQADEAAVKNMLRNRILRDKETDLVKKQEYKQLALDGLETATETMMNLCDVCLDIIPMALQVYKVGLRSAQGDTAVAISTLLSAASSGLYTSLINIKLAKGAAWTIAKRSDLEKYFGRLHEYQYIHSGRLATMYNNI